MHKLAIYGAGGHGKVIADTANALGWQDIVFFDEAWPQHQAHSTWRVSGNFDSLVSQLNQFSGVVIGIGNCSARLKLHRQLSQLGAQMVSLAHPMSYVSPFAVIGNGSVVFAGGIVNIDAMVGEACIINTGATVDHDCKLGDGVHICPGAHLSGGVTVGDESWIGVGASVRHSINIGSKVIIGAGSVIVKDVLAGSTMVGVAAESLNLNK